MMPIPVLGTFWVQLTGYFKLCSFPPFPFLELFVDQVYEIVFKKYPQFGAGEMSRLEEALGE